MLCKGEPDRRSGTGGYIVSSVHCLVREKVNPPKKGNLGAQTVMFGLNYMVQTVPYSQLMSIYRFHVINIPCFGICSAVTISSVRSSACILLPPYIAHSEVLQPMEQ